jgi:transposase
MPDAQELATLTLLLGLEDLEVVEATWDRREKLRRFELVPRTAVGLCPDCHGATDRRHVCHDRVVADLPMGDQRVELVVRLWQFECDRCGRFFTPRFAALAEGAHATERLLQRLAELAGHGDIATAARFSRYRRRPPRDGITPISNAELNSRRRRIYSRCGRWGSMNCL